MNNDNQSIKKVRDLVGQNRLQEAIAVLNEVINETKVLKNDTALITDLTNIKGQLASFKRSNDIGIFNLEEKTINESKLRNSILNFVIEIESKLNQKPILSTKPKNFKFKSVTLYLMVLPLAMAYYYFVFNSKTDQKAWLNESGLYVMLENSDYRDTILSIDKLLKIVECEYREGEKYALEFNLDDLKNENYKNLEISLKETFIEKNENIWYWKIEGWTKIDFDEDYDRSIYKYNDPLINTATFTANYTND